MNFVEINVTFWNLGETILKRASQHRGLSLFFVFSLYMEWLQVCPAHFSGSKSQIYGFRERPKSMPISAICHRKAFIWNQHPS